jgi:hypothetical protein
MKSVLMAVLVMCAVVWGQTTPVVTLVSPVAHEEWVIGSTHQIQWTGQCQNSMREYAVQCGNTPWIQGQSRFIVIKDTIGTFTSGSFNQTWTVPDSLDSGLAAIGIYMWNINLRGFYRDTIRIIGHPKFTSPKIDSVVGGTVYSYKVKYTLPGNPVRYTRKLISKPTWITVDTAKDSIYGTSPVKEGTDTVKYAVKAYTQRVFQSRTQSPIDGHMDTTWTAIDSIADTLKLAIHVKYLVTGVTKEMPKYALNLSIPECVYDLRGRKTLRTSAPGIYFGDISRMKKILCKK